jgi:phosphoserine phosphatase RsbU/P
MSGSLPPLLGALNTDSRKPRQKEYHEFMRKQKLLVADDDAFFQGLIPGLLSPEYEVIVAHDGLEAWEQLQQPDPPRLVILDWVMPGLSGPQICRNVRASESLSSIYVILLTARNNESDIIAGLNSGADDYITKPPLPAELRARIKMGERVLALQDAVKSQALTSSRRKERRSSIEAPPSRHMLTSDVSRDLQPGANSELEFERQPESRQSAGKSTTKTRGLLPQREYSVENYHSK